MEQLVALIQQDSSINDLWKAALIHFYLFTEEVYHKLRSEQPDRITTDTFRQALQNGNITEKEHALWQFVLTAYADQPFSTKQLEKDFGNAAYATIRGFVLKFTALGLLRATKFSTRTKYQVVMQALVFLLTVF